MSETLDDVRISVAAGDRAEALMELGRYEQAIPLLSKSLAETPDDDYLHSRLADAHFSMGDNENALHFAQRALHLNPNSVHAHFRIAWINLRTHQYDTALEHARAAISIYPDDAANLYTLAWAEYHSGHFEPALSAAKSAIKLDPENADLHELIADLLFNLDQEKQAVFHYREALRHDPQSASIHCSLGQCLAAQHKVHEASEHLLSAVKIEPANEHFRNTLFNIVHYDLMDMPLQSREAALAGLDPMVQHFYQDQLEQRGWFAKLRMTSMATLWLLIFMLVLLFFTWITGEDYRKLSVVVILIASVYAILFTARIVIKAIRLRNHKNR